MSGPLFTIKIDVKKCQREHFYVGAKTSYMDCAVWENRDGPDQYGNTHYITQSVSKEARAKGVKGNIIGNMKMNETEQRPAPRAPSRSEQKPSTGAHVPATDECDDIPF